nr:YdeA protein [Escherichia coli]
MTVDSEPPTVATAAESADCAGCPDENYGTVLTRDIERVCERSGKPGLRPNLRASCRRLEDAGWFRTLRARTCWQWS